MLYLLLIFFPISMAATCFVLRQRTVLVITAAVATMLIQIALAAQIPLDAPARLLGTTLTLNALNRLFMLIFLGIGITAFIASLHLPHGENFVPVMLLVLSLASTTLLLQDLFIVSLLLIGASLVIVLAIVDMPTGTSALLATRTIASALKYLVLMVLAGVLMYLSFVLTDIYRPGEVSGRIPLARFILGLLSAGFALRLALAPFHAWLVDVVEDAAPLVSALVIAVFNVIGLLVLVLTFQSFPALLTENAFGLGVLRIGGIVTSIAGGLLAFAQTSMRRSLAYLLVYNAGMIFYGLVSVSTVGLAGAMFEALNQTLSVTLLFISLGLLEQPDGRPANVVRRDLLWRWPVAGAGLISGGLALLGLPPFNGFASKLLIYQAAAQQGWIDLVALVVATVLGGLALMKLAHEWLLGQGDEAPVSEPALLGEIEIDRPPERRLDPEPRGPAILAMLLLMICLGIGVYPEPVLATIDDVIRSLAFVRAL